MTCEAPLDALRPTTPQGEAKPLDRARRPHLADIPSDIIYLVCSNLCSLQPHVDRRPRISTISQLAANYARTTVALHIGRHALLSLSCSCRALRALCLPLIFRAITFAEGLGQRHDSVPPLSILPLVHELHLSQLAFSQSREPYASTLQSMPNLRQIYFVGPWTPMSCDDLLSVAFSAPALETLTIEGVQFADLPLVQRPSPPRLRTVRVGYRERLSYPPRARFKPAMLPTEAAALEYLVDGVHTFIETLELPAESLRTSFLVKYHWPQLRSLTISGACPVLDAPLIRVISYMPLLQELVLAVAQQEGAPPLIIWPRDADKSLHVDLSRLRRLAITFPHENDGIFAHLSSDISSISLFDSPRYYRRKYLLHSRHRDKARFYGAPLLSCAGAMRIFETLDGTNLQSLELVLAEDSWEYHALAQVARSCPSLRIFEYHQYRLINLLISPWSDTTEVPVARIAQALSAFTSVRILRLYFDFPYMFDEYQGPSLERYEEAHAFIDGHAQTVANALPWLDRLSILARHRVGCWDWRNWSVLKLDDATPLLSFESLTKTPMAEWS